MNEKDKEVDPLKLFIKFGMKHEISKIQQDITIDTIKILNNLPDDIEKLYIEFEQPIKSMKELNLTRFKNLKELKLNINKIEKIENLPKSLRTLSLSNNKITKIENLPDSLTHLYLNNNEIKKIENLPETLTLLSLKNNEIIKIDSQSLDILIQLDRFIIEKKYINTFTDMYVCMDEKITKIENCITLE